MQKKILLHAWTKVRMDNAAAETQEMHSEHLWCMWHHSRDLEDRTIDCQGLRSAHLQRRCLHWESGHQWDPSSALQTLLPLPSAIEMGL